MSRQNRMNRRRFLRTSMAGIAGTSMISGTRFRDRKTELWGEQVLKYRISDMESVCPAMPMS